MVDKMVLTSKPPVKLWMPYQTTATQPRQPMDFVSNRFTKHDETYRR